MYQEVLHLDAAYTGDLTSYSDVELFDMLNELPGIMEQSVMLLNPRAGGSVYHFQEVYGATNKLVGELETRELVDVERTPRPGPYGSTTIALHVEAKDRDLAVDIDYFADRT